MAGQEDQLGLLKARALLFELFLISAMASQTTQNFVWIIYARTRKLPGKITSLLHTLWSSEHVGVELRTRQRGRLCCMPRR